MKASAPGAGAAPLAVSVSAVRRPTVASPPRVGPGSYLVCRESRPPVAVRRRPDPGISSAVRYAPVAKSISPLSENWRNCRPRHTIVVTDRKATERDLAASAGARLMTDSAHGALASVQGDQDRKGTGQCSAGRRQQSPALLRPLECLGLRSASSSRRSSDPNCSRAGSRHGSCDCWVTARPPMPGQRDGHDRLHAAY